MKKTILISRFALLAVVAALAACGGGGGADEDATAPTTPGIPVAPGTPFVPAGTLTSYAPGSTATLALDAVNKSITHCGYPAMVPVADLSGAAKAMHVT
ncbi:hypothetical protein [Simplicispira lacusdiani]|uniref:hypothetical protein n=1 Tax=Simplicispira lacusdiani TaxID=2213010 RepID=UPI000E707FB8|nr:hypothetical protein [Simplicispira lacusdiani]